jgi:hypothetical protein
LSPKSASGGNVTVSLGKSVNGGAPGCVHLELPLGEKGALLQGRVVGAPRPAFALTDTLAFFGGAVAAGVSGPPYDVETTTYTPDASKGNFLEIVRTDGVPFRIRDARNPTVGQTLTFLFVNASTDVIPDPEWDQSFLRDGSFSMPAPGKHRTITFYRSALIPPKWVQVGAASADV